MNGFSWHWDLEGAGLSMPEYRRMMVNFVRTQGFKEQYTNEPNVAMREENFFTVRIGERVLQEDVRKFKNLRFGMKPS
jgi:acetoin utilization protein AcuA